MWRNTVKNSLSVVSAPCMESIKQQGEASLSTNHCCAEGHSWTDTMSREPSPVQRALKEIPNALTP